ncbi:MULTISPECIES: cation:proton antiporter [unclassified Pseudoclavibacter]|uniref:cation:proton antiporter n=1 Tax=unclassified Pseudoclavibacter TaxID=2615177 RepID=UPI0013014AFA|nr:MULTISPECIES: cation:proton antiporter [unclassified Pseudoclavibacter]KAB1658703.1 sodium:proton antiporter [Pseudoclavibacter sp. CFCC 11306]KAB1661236.1 sodium:proton antiporter [Pseudoclavibacter sp. CFCC 13796]
MNHLLLFTLLTMSVLITAFARRRGWSSPLVIVILTSAISFLPFVPHFDIDSELILTLVLPPLLYSSALNVSVISFRKNLRDISMLGVVLVIVTAAVAGFVAYMVIPDMTWAAALLLGAIIAPPDAVSAASVGRKLNLPRRLMTVLLGESLINDATSLTMMKVALTLVGGAALTFADDLGIFGLAVGVGIGLGVVMGVVYNWLRRRLNDPVIESLLGLLLPFFAYTGAEHFGGSGVLAVVAAGLLVGYASPTFNYRTRLQDEPLWKAIDVLLEGMVFALIGLQLHSVSTNLVDGGRGILWSLSVAALVLVAVILVRPAFVFATYGLQLLGMRLRRSRHSGSPDSADASAPPGERSVPSDPSLLTRSIMVLTPENSSTRRFAVRAKNTVRAFGSSQDPLKWNELLVLSWTGMRGVVTLAASLSIPVVMSDGSRFPGHDMLVFIAFVVTVGTLLLQGLTLPALIRVLNVEDKEQPKRDRAARQRLLRTSLAEATDFVKKREGNWRKKFGDEAVDRAITNIESRLSRIEHQLDAAEHQEVTALASRHITELRRQVLRTRREILLRERNAGHIDEELMREVMAGLDAEELALDESVVGAR